MFYVYNVSQWLDEVIDNCNEHNLNPEDSTFLLMIFSSLDFDFVAFFKDRKNQISQYSGNNVHIFTPMIYDEGVVPDGEWRFIRDEFAEADIPVTNRPFSIFFHLRKRENGSGFEPEFFAGFECRNFERFQDSLRDVVDVSIKFRHDQTRLTKELSLLLNTPNVVRRLRANKYGFFNQVEENLNVPKFFISYSHNDREFVSWLYSQLKSNHVKLWLDQEELTPGSLLQPKIEECLRNSDGLLTILSKNSLESKWLSFEGSFFYSQQDEKPIIPIILDYESKQAVSKLPFLKDRLYLDFSDESARVEGISKLKEYILKLSRG